IIAFTKLDIPQYYAVKLSVSNDSIQILGKDMPIQIIDKWEVSIRPCEMNNFSKILGQDSNVSGSREFYELLKFLTMSGFNLVEIMDFNEVAYSNFKRDRKSTRLNSSHVKISYAVFCLKKKKNKSIII